MHSILFFINTCINLSLYLNKSNPENFKRAYAGATIHDIFNFLTVSILLPLEIASRYLETVTGFLVAPLSKFSNSEANNIELLNALTKPLTNLIIQLEENENEDNQTNNEQTTSKSLIKYWCIDTNYKKRCSFIFSDTSLPDWSIGLILLIISLVVLCTCLIVLVKILSSIFKGKFLKIIQKIVNSKSTGLAGYLMGYIAILVFKFFIS